MFEKPTIVGAWRRLERKLTTLMSSSEKAIVALRRLQGRIAELTEQITSAEDKLRLAEAEASDAASEPDFEEMLAKVPTAAARVDALRRAKSRLEADLMPTALNVIAARRQDSLEEADRLQREVYEVHAKALALLDQVAEILGIERGIPLRAVCLTNAPGDDFRTLDWRKHGFDWHFLTPKTAKTMEHIDRIRHEASQHIDDPDLPGILAKRLLAEPIGEETAAA